jgi:hypothetical protein
MENLKGWAVVTDRGITTKGKYNLPPNMDNATKKMLINIQNQLKNLSIPLPKNKVGIGAQWDVTTNLEVNGLNVTNVYTYTLTKFSKNIGVFNLTYTQNAKEQEIKNSDLPKGTKIFLKKLINNGTGAVNFNSNTIFLKSKINSKMEMYSRIQSGANSQNMKLDLELDIATVPVK